VRVIVVVDKRPAEVEKDRPYLSRSAHRVPEGLEVQIYF
jgi:polyphosphate kinase 2 (PPK2 family)